MSRQNIILIFLVVILGIGYVLAQKARPALIEKEPVSDQRKASNTTLENTTSCNGKETISLAEGPYYKSGSPMRQNLVEGTMSGTRLELVGYVFDNACQPLANVWIDFWQADSKGEYDISGYVLRGHQYTDATGRYMLTTVVPGEYPGRTPHIHVKLRASANSQTVTSQVFMPNEQSNNQDAIFDASLIMKITDRGEKLYGQYNFIIPR